MYPTKCVTTNQRALRSSTSSAHAGVETASRPPCRATARPSLSLALSLARSLARSASSRAAISPSPPPPRHLSPETWHISWWHGAPRARGRCIPRKWANFSRAKCNRHQPRMRTITPRHVSYSLVATATAPIRLHVVRAPSAPCWPRTLAYFSLRLRAAKMLASARVSASGSSREPVTLATSTAALAAAMAATAACWKTRWIWAMR